MDHEALEQTLRQLAEEDASLNAPPHVEAAVLAAFRRRKSTRYAWVALAAAAALVLGIATALLWPAGAAMQQTNVVSRPDATQGQAEIGTDYFPLRAGPVLDAGELAHVIRVPATPAMLARFGMTQAAGWDAAPVHADVLLGFDGTARAVRFVR